MWMTWGIDAKEGAEPGRVERNKPLQQKIIFMYIH